MKLIVNNLKFAFITNLKNLNYFKIKLYFFYILYNRYIYKLYVY